MTRLATTIWRRLMADGSDVPLHLLSALGTTADEYMRWMSDILPSTVQFEISNVAEYFWQSEKTSWYWRTDFPNSAPVYPAMWFEYRNPHTINTAPRKGGRKSLDWVRDEPGVGVLVQAREPDASSITLAERATRDKGIPCPELADVAWHLDLYTYIDRRGQKVLGPIFVSVVLVAHDGRPLIGPITLGGEEGMIGAKGFDMYPVGLALAFLHCKNVTVTENEPSASRQERRLRDRRGLAPEPRFKTLVIEPMKDVLRTEGQSERVGINRALHICRGHFAHYSDDKPLFGKYAGTFWKPAHVRGTADAGVVGKDYSVKAPKEERNG